MQKKDRRENHFLLYLFHQGSSQDWMSLLCGSIAGYDPAWHRYRFCDVLLFHSHHVNRQGFAAHIFCQLHWQYFFLMKFYRYPEDRQNKVSGSSYRLLISGRPGIQGSVLLFFPCRNDRYQAPSLLFSGHICLRYILPREDQASGQGDYKQPNNQAWWDASFPASQFLFETFLLLQRSIFLHRPFSASLLFPDRSHRHLILP